MAAPSVGRRSCAGQKETAALIVSKPPLHKRVEMCLLYDGFFLLPSCGRFLIIPKEILLYMVHYLSVLDSVCIIAKKNCGSPVLKNSYQKFSVSD